MALFYRLYCLFDPAQNYMRRNSGWSAHGTPPWRPTEGSPKVVVARLAEHGTDGSKIALPTPRQLEELHNEGQHRIEEIEAAEAELLRTRGPELQSRAEEVLAEGATTIQTQDGSVHARLIRFWNGKSVLDITRSGERSDGRSLSEIGRGELDEGGVEVITESLAQAIVALHDR